MKIVRLTGAGSALTAQVDDTDYDRVIKFPWRLVTGGYAGYAHRGHVIMMHRLVSECPKGSVVDHINGDKLDNRRSNLRICTHKENTRYQRISHNNRSGFKGVCKRHDGRFDANIVVDGKSVYLGRYSNCNDAALAYNWAAVQHFGPFAWLNEVSA